MSTSFDAAGPVSATQVGSYFVQEYYQILQQRPDYAYQFYKDSSSIVRVDGETTQSACALMQIHALIASLNFTTIEIKTINSLESWSGGVLVVVSGSVKSKDFGGWRKFLHTFFLAPQEKGYFVLNDIFHFVNEEVINQPPASGVPEEIHQTPAPIGVENEFDSQPTSSIPLQEPPGESKSIYVKNLPSGISNLEIVEEFKNFGRVKQEGVFVNNRKASPIKLAGRQVYVELRKSSISSTSRGWRRGHGRGGRLGGRRLGTNLDGSDSYRGRSNGFHSS